eukprot:TRINITY_DN2906_c0_g1_i1.p1 TRINITY_DN2906_c0_g1~~TRINITY_DN2906_c0_g1_i1.p1  ORF type:complete len:687 (+),score=106.70 TRINITY_DN2906_c0_g1_i1:47-2107(+)
MAETSIHRTNSTNKIKNHRSLIKLHRSNSSNRKRGITGITREDSAPLKIQAYRQSNLRRAKLEKVDSVGAILKDFGATSKRKSLVLDDDKEPEIKQEQFNMDNVSGVLISDGADDDDDRLFHVVNLKKSHSPLAQFKITKVISSSGNNSVLKAGHITKKRIVAIKKIHGNKPYLIKVQRKIKRMKVLKSEYLPRCYGWYSVYDTNKNWCLWIINQYCDRQSILDIYESQKIGLLPLAYIFKTVTLGLDYIHEVGIVHASLRPQNILLSKNGTVKLGGLNHLTELDEQRVNNTEMLYNAPEVAYTGNFSKESDIWALGICLMYLTDVISKRDFLLLSTNNDLRTKLEDVQDHLSSMPYLQNFALNFIYLCLNPDPEYRPDTKMLLEHGYFRRIHQDSIFDLFENTDYKIKVPYTTFEEDFLNAVNVEEFSDVKIIHGSNIYYMHRVILLSRCPEIVNMIENEDELVVSEHVTFGSVVLLINWIYSGYLYIDATTKTKDETMEQLIELVRLCKTYNMLDLARRVAKVLLNVKRVAIVASRRVPIAKNMAIEYDDNYKENIEIRSNDGTPHFLPGILMYARCEYYLQRLQNPTLILKEDSEVIKEFIGYIATDCLSEISSGSLLMKLLMFANSIQMHRLVALCETKLIVYSEGRVEKFSQWAEQSGANQLHRYCENIIKRNERKGIRLL